MKNCLITFLYSDFNDSSTSFTIIKFVLNEIVNLFRRDRKIMF